MWEQKKSSTDRGLKQGDSLLSTYSPGKLIAKSKVKIGLNFEQNPYQCVAYASVVVILSLEGLKTNKTNIRRSSRGQNTDKGKQVITSNNDRNIEKNIGGDENFSEIQETFLHQRKCQEQ